MRPQKPRKRSHARFRYTGQLEASQLAPAGKPAALPGVLRCKTENISTGGICIRSKRPLENSPLVRCELRLPGVPARIPFLAQVRWSEKRGANDYRVGLQFLV
jgi:hypothetical protein